MNTGSFKLQMHNFQNIITGHLSFDRTQGFLLFDFLKQAFLSENYEGISLSIYLAVIMFSSSCHKQLLFIVFISNLSTHSYSLKWELLI